MFLFPDPVRVSAGSTTARSLAREKINVKRSRQLRATIPLCLYTYIHMLVCVRVGVYMGIYTHSLIRRRVVTTAACVTYYRAGFKSPPPPHV